MRTYSQKIVVGSQSFHVQQENQISSVHVGFQRAIQFSSRKRTQRPDSGVAVSGMWDDPYLRHRCPSSASWDWTLGPNLLVLQSNQSVGTVGTCHIFPLDIGECSHFSNFFPTLICSAWQIHLFHVSGNISSQWCESGAISEFYQLWPLLQEALTLICPGVHFSNFSHHFFQVSQDVSIFWKVTISITWSTGARLWPPWGTCQQPWDFWIRPRRARAKLKSVTTAILVTHIAGGYGSPFFYSDKMQQY